jgi:hypothetical protein
MMYFASIARTSSICLCERLVPGLDGLPSAIECGNQSANGVRIKYAGVYMIVEEVAHASLRGARLF